MNEQTFALLLQLLLQYGPGTYLGAVNLFHKQNPTRNDLLALLDSIGSEKYEDFIAAHKLTPPISGPIPVAPAPFSYYTIVTTAPSDAQLKTGDAVYAAPNLTSPTSWYVMISIAGGAPPPAGFELLRYVP